MFSRYFQNDYEINLKKKQNPYNYNYCIGSKNKTNKERLVLIYGDFFLFTNFVQLLYTQNLLFYMVSGQNLLEK